MHSSATLTEGFFRAFSSVVRKIPGYNWQPNIVMVIKSRRMRWAGHVARMVEERGCIGSWWGNRREGDHWGDLGVDGWIILGWICEERGCIGSWWGNRRERDHWTYLGVDE